MTDGLDVGAMMTRKPLIDSPDILARIEGAKDRLRDGHALMRIPVDPTDPDCVLADAELEIKRLRALLSASKPADQRNDCRAHLWALVDIWDDQDNEPEARCYIDGAFKQQIDDARTFLAAFPAASPAAPAQSGEPVYQIEQSNGSWLDVSKVAYQSTEDYRRRIVYAAPQPSQPVEAGEEKS